MEVLSPAPERVVHAVLISVSAAVVRSNICLRKPSSKPGRPSCRQPRTRRQSNAPHLAATAARTCLGYRRRARVGAKFVTKKGKVVVGFRERLAPFIADVRHCDVLTPPVGDLITPLAELIMTLGIRERLPQIEVAVADNAVAMVFRVLDPPSSDDLERFRAFRATHGVRVYLQPGGLDSVHELDTPGEPLRYALPKFTVELEFLPTDFIQINGAVNEALVSRAVELLELTPSAEVLDLFCGIGNFTLPMARSAKRVVGVEGDAALVARARHNAQRNQLENTEFHVADLARLPGSASTVGPTSAPNFRPSGGQPSGSNSRPSAGGAGLAIPPWLRKGYTHVVLDPPRAGAREVLASIVGLEPRRVLYISCHPAAWHGTWASWSTNMGLLSKLRVSSTCFPIRLILNRWRF